MIKMPPPGHALREHIDPAQVAQYCDPADTRLQTNIADTVKTMTAWMGYDPAVNSVTALCTEDGHHLLIRVTRGGVAARLWDFTTGRDYTALEPVPDEEERVEDWNDGEPTHYLG